VVERELSRAGMTALNLEAVAHEAGFAKLDDFFAAVARTEINTRQVQAAIQALAKPDAAPVIDDQPVVVPKQSKAAGAGSGILIVGVDRLMTGLARCCKPAPPDPIVGARAARAPIPRQSCTNVVRMREARARSPVGAPARVFRSMIVEAMDRQGLLRDVSSFPREDQRYRGQYPVTQSQARMSFTLEVPDPPAVGALLLVRDAVCSLRAGGRTSGNPLA
jgi:GTP pyrophosphokinase